MSVFVICRSDPGPRAAPAPAPANLTTSYGYDALGRLTSVTDALSQVTSYGYDELGNLIRQTDANNHTTTFEYDSMGRRVKRTLPEGQIETYAYDVAGNMTNKVDFNGKVTTFAYDELNRLTAKIPDASFAASNIVFTYTDSGQRLSMSDQSGVTTYSYDDRDRLTEKVTPIGSLVYGYNLQGSLTNIETQVSGLRSQVSYAYDSLNRLHSVLDPRTGLTAYNYDDVGNLQDYIYPNGVSHAYEYDGLNRLTNMAMNRLLTPLATYQYTLNPSGHRLSERRTGNSEQRTVNYSYDNLYRLTQETISGSIIAGTITYTYDPVGNRQTRNSTLGNIVSKVYDYDMNDRLGSDSYDAAGNTVAAEVRGQTSEVSYTYDFENRILSATSAVSAVQLLYDGDGNRVGKTVNGMTIRYLVDDRNPSGYSQVMAEMSEVSGQRSVDRVYTYGLDLISQDQIRGTNWVPSFYGYDGHGNVRFLTDESGNITDSYDYDAFGTLIEQRVWDPSFMSLVLVTTDNQQLTTDNRYLYCGEQFDPDLNLYFLRARYLDTDRGRFWTVDPFEGLRHNPFSLQKYLYVAANPVNRIDPSGRLLMAELAVSAIGRTVDYLGYLMAKTAFMRAQSILRNTIPAFSVHGEWCGPGWCNGRWQAEDDYFSVAASTGTFLPPWDAVDTCCFHHDACVAGYSSSSAGPLVHNPSLTKDKCDSTFCDCVKKASCPSSWKGCRLAKQVIEFWCSKGAPF